MPLRSGGGPLGTRRKHGSGSSLLRVSTVRQGQSGLGLEAQQTAIQDFLRRGGYVLDREFREVESGKKTDRVQLRSALEYCRKFKATLLIARLDRLARIVGLYRNAFRRSREIHRSRHAKADRTFLHLAAVFAESEGRNISQRTKVALAAAKARGTKLGFSSSSMQKSVSTKGNATIKRLSDEFALKTVTVFTGIKAAGVTTPAAIARALNNLGVPTLRPGKWHSTSVKRVINRTHLLSNSAGRG